VVPARGLRRQSMATVSHYSKLPAHPLPAERLLASPKMEAGTLSSYQRGRVVNRRAITECEGALATGKERTDMYDHQSQAPSTHHKPFDKWLKKALRLNRDPVLFCAHDGIPGARGRIPSYSSTEAAVVGAVLHCVVWVSCIARNQERVVIVFLLPKHLKADSRVRGSSEKHQAQISASTRANRYASRGRSLRNRDPQVLRQGTRYHACISNQTSSQISRATRQPFSTSILVS
jgi:hypothetical protein